MKIKIEIDPALSESEVVIRCAAVDESVARVQRFAAQQAAADTKLTAYKGEDEYYLAPADILFFETEGEVVYAHTAREAFRTKVRLYELEESLPRSFVRVAKSAIVNTAKIYAIKRDLASASLVQFADTHKQVYASRRYYKELKLRMQERSRV